jgi:TolA-binding protein
MGAVTYPDPDVVAELNLNFVPCRLESAKVPELARKMNLRWLPGLVVADSTERPAHVVIGFLPPADFRNELDFGRAMAAMTRKRYDEAHALFARVAHRLDGERAPEAWYWWGISRYRESKEFADCQEKWRQIVAHWPGTQWARRVEYALVAGATATPPG